MGYPYTNPKDVIGKTTEGTTMETIGRVLDCGVGVEEIPPEVLNDEVFLTLRILRGSWDLWGRVSALGARVWDLTTRVQEH